MKERDEVLCVNLQTDRKVLRDLLQGHKSLQSIFTCPSSHHQRAIRDSMHPIYPEITALQLGAEETVVLLTMLPTFCMFNHFCSPALWIYPFCQYFSISDKLEVLNPEHFKRLPHSIHISVVWEGHRKEVNCSENHFWTESLWGYPK